MLSISDFVPLVGAQYIAPSPPLRELCVSVPRLPPSGLGIKPCRIRRSPISLPQLFYNPHLQEPFGSAGNNRLTTTKSTHINLLESTLARILRKCGKQRAYKSIGIRTCENCACNLFRIRTYKNGGHCFLRVLRAWRRGVSWSSRHMIRFSAKRACGIIPPHAAVSRPIRGRGGFSE
jgi:hypothetical protein